MNKSNGILESIFSLSILNVLNIFLPLITLPYLIRVVGLEKYGAYSVVYAILQYALLFSSYGFIYSTTKEISQNRNNIEEVNQIFNSTIVARIVLSIVSLILLFPILLLYNESDYIWMYIYGIGIVIGDSLNPVWLFQGMEKMRYMTIVNVICKLIFTVLIFVLVNTPDDYIYILLYNSLGFVFSGIGSLYIAIKYFGVVLFFPSWHTVSLEIKLGWYVFVSTLFMNLYRNSNIFILSFFVPEKLIGAYSGAEKMIKAAQSIASPVSNAFFPHFANQMVSKEKAVIRNIFSKLFAMMALFLVPITIVAYFCSDLINDFFLDPNDSRAVLLMKIMSPVIFFGGLNYILGIVGLVNLGKSVDFTKYVIIAGITSIVFLLVSVKEMGVLSAAYAMTLSEVILFIMCFFRCRMLLR